jgi:hypothetical protein
LVCHRRLALNTAVAKGDSGKRKTAKNDEDPAIIHTTYSPLVGILTNSKQSSTCGYVHNSDASVTQ